MHSVYAASLPTTHPSFAPQMHLEMVTKWKAPPLPYGHVELFIGILSAGNHFAERMAVRKSWMQHKLVKSSRVVARFFVALVRMIVKCRYCFMINHSCISFTSKMSQLLNLYFDSTEERK